MNDAILDNLVRTGAITRYSYNHVDCEGNTGLRSDHRNTEQLILHFPNGETLVIDTFCSGVREDTSLIFSNLRSFNGCPTQTSIEKSMTF